MWNFSLDKKFFTSYNNGFCCTSDNVLHDWCYVSTGPKNNVRIPGYTGSNIPGYEEGFEISECPTRCLNDTKCRGFSVLTTIIELPNPDDLVTISFDTCFLFTTSNATSTCVFHLPDNLDKPSTSMGPLDPYAACDGNQAYERFTYDYNDGCNIRMDQDNFTAPVTGT